MGKEITTIDGNCRFEDVARLVDAEGRVAVVCGATAKYLVTPILTPELCDQCDVAPLDQAMNVARSLMKRYESTFKELAK